MNNDHYQDEMLQLSKAQSKKYWDNQVTSINWDEIFELEAGELLNALADLTSTQHDEYHEQAAIRRALKSHSIIKEAVDDIFTDATAATSMDYTEEEQYTTRGTGDNERRTCTKHNRQFVTVVTDAHGRQYEIDLKITYKR